MHYFWSVYFWLPPVVSLTRNHRDLRRSLSKYYFHLGHWMLILICTGQKRWSSQAETLPCCPGSHISLLTPFSEPWDIPVSRIQDVSGLGKRQRDEKKSSYWQGLLQAEGNFQKYRGHDLCLHNSKWTMHCFGFQKFQLGTFVFTDVQIAGQNLFCENGVFLMKKITPQHQRMLPPAPFGFRRRAAWISLDKGPDPHITARCSMLCFFLCLQEVWENFNKNI